MNILSAPVAVIGGITLYVGLYHLFIHRKRLVKTRIDRSFAIACFNMALYDAFCVLAYNASSYAQGLVWQRFPWQMRAYALDSQGLPATAPFFAERIDKPDDEAPHHGTFQAAQAAHDHHDQGQNEDLPLRAGVEGQEGSTGYAA